MSSIFATGKLKQKSEKCRFLAKKLPTNYGFAEKIGVLYSTPVLSRKRRAEKADGRKKRSPTEFQKFCNVNKAAKEIQRET